MRNLLIFAHCVCFVYAGVQPWSPEGEEEALRLYRQYCTGYQDRGVDGDVQWFCKSPKEPTTVETYNHYQVITSRPQKKKQIIFIDTPSKTYRHNVVVKGQSGFESETSIYVLPPKNKHEVDITGDIDSNSVQNKPHLFYVKESPKGGHDDGYYPHYPDRPYYPATSSPHENPYYPTTSRPSRPYYPSTLRPINRPYYPTDSHHNHHHHQHPPPPVDIWAKRYDDPIHGAYSDTEDTFAKTTTAKTDDHFVQDEDRARGVVVPAPTSSTPETKAETETVKPKKTSRKRGSSRSSQLQAEPSATYSRPAALKTTSNGLFIYPH